MGTGRTVEITVPRVVVRSSGKVINRRERRQYNEGGYGHLR